LILSTIWVLYLLIIISKSKQFYSILCLGWNCELFFLQGADRKAREEDRKRTKGSDLGECHSRVVICTAVKPRCVFHYQAREIYSVVDSRYILNAIECCMLLELHDHRPPPRPPRAFTRSVGSLTSTHFLPWLAPDLQVQVREGSEWKHRLRETKAIDVLYICLKCIYA